jgi:arabinose-5-phosphate isomerase
VAFDHVAAGRRVMMQEAAAITNMAGALGPSFVRAADLLLACKGRAVTTGIGKAGAVARKAAATLASTGTPALYLHPAEGVHGDLGAVTPDDVVLALSYSGESDEVSRILPTLQRIGAPVIAVTGNEASTLGVAAALVLDVSVEREACPLGLAPTTSAVAMLSMCDALAMAVMEARGFTREDFALCHPAGALGRRLTLRVSDVMRSGDQMAVTGQNVLLRDALFAITRAHAGAAFLTDHEGKLTGLLTDGDVRRVILTDRDALDQPAHAVMNTSPLTIAGNILAADALSILQESPKRPGEAPVIDADCRPVGLLMIKDLLRCGIV